MPIQLSPEVADSLSKAFAAPTDTRTQAVNPAQTAQPSSMMARGNAGQSLTPDQQQRLDTSTNNEVKRQPPLIDGSKYEQYDVNNDPSLNQNWFKKAAVSEGIVPNPQKDAVDARNQDLYQKSGDGTLFGIPGAPRVQHTSENGQKGTAFVPLPKDTAHNIGDDISNMAVGGALQAAKSTAGFAEWGADTLIHPFVTTAKLIGLIDKNALTPDQVNWASENMPTLPAQTEIDKAGQEIMSVVIGSIGGAAIASEITKLPRVGQQIAQIALKVVERNSGKAVDVTNKLAEAQLVVKSALTEYMGANVGATVTTPDQTKPMPWLGGAAASQIPGLNQHDQDRVGNFIDNTALSALFGFAGSKMKQLTGLGKAVFSPEGKKLSNEGQLVSHLLQQVDPDLQNLSPDEFMRRAQIFSDTVKVKSKVNLVQFGDWTHDPATTMVTGAENYVKNAYDYLKTSMPADKWEAFVKQKAADVSNNFIAARRDNLKSTIVQSADSLMAGKVQSSLGSAADAIGTPETTRQAGINIGTSAANELHQIQGKVDTASSDLRMAQGNQKLVSHTDPVLSDVYDKSHNGVIPTPASQDATLNTLSQKISDNAVAAKADVDQTFANLPDEGGPGNFNTKAVATALKSSGEVDNFMKFMNLPVHDPAIGAIGDQSMSDTAKGIKAPRTLKAEELGNTTVKELFTKGRPWVSQRITDLTNSLRNPSSAMDMPGIRSEIATLQNLRDVIDEQAKKYGGPEYEAAVAKYSEYRDKFFGIPEQVPVSEGAVSADKSGFSGAARANLKDARALVENAVSGGDKSGELLKAVNATLEDPNLTKDLANSILDQATTAITLGSKDGYTTAKAMDQAIQPHIRALTALDQDAMNRYTKARNAMAMAESGSKDAQKELDRVELEATKSRRAVSETAAAQFLDKQGDSFIVKDGTGDIQRTFNKMFQDQGKTRQLLDLAEKNGDKTLVEGIQNQYLRYLKGKLFTTKGLAADGEGAINHEASQAFMKQFFSDADKSHLDVLNEVFRDKPKTAEDLTNLFQALDMSTGARNVSPNTFNSRTVVDNERQKTMGLLITAMLGSLNPTATKVRGFSNRVSEALNRNDQQLIDRVIPSLLVDTDYLTKTIDKLVTDHSETSLKTEALKLINSSASKGLTKGVPTTLKGESDYSKTPDALGSTGANKPVNITIPYGKK
jgi:hypothetical protein